MDRDGVSSPGSVICVNYRSQLFYSRFLVLGPWDMLARGREGVKGAGWEERREKKKRGKEERENSEAFFFFNRICRFTLMMKVLCPKREKSGTEQTEWRRVLTYT